MDFDYEINALKLEQQKLLNEKAGYEAKRALYESLLAIHALRPSHQVPVRLKRDGSKWLCVFEVSRNILECVAAYGDSPEQAMLNFDMIWMGRGANLPVPDRITDEDFGDDDDLDDYYDDDDDDDDEYYGEY